MKHLSVVRSMSTREADHGRGRYYMHTAYIPNPTVVHPTFGSVVSYELGTKRKELEIPVVRVDRRRQHGPGLHGHDALAVPGRQQRRDPQRVDARKI